MSRPDSPAQHVAAIPGVTSAVVTDGRMLVGVEPGLDATTVALRAAIVLNALGAGLTVEVIGGSRTPAPAPLPVRWAGLSMTNMARVACAAVLAGSAGLAAISNVSGSVPTPRLLAGPVLRHHATPVPAPGIAPFDGVPRVAAPPEVVVPVPGAAPTEAPAAGLTSAAPRSVTPNVVLLVSVRHTAPPAVTATPPPATPPPATPPPATPAPEAPTAPVTPPVSPQPTVPVAGVPQGVVASNKPPVVNPVPPVVTPTPPVTPTGHGDGSDEGHRAKDGHGDDEAARSSHAGDAASVSVSTDHEGAAPKAPVQVRASEGSAEAAAGHARLLPSS
jgi:hypothetical protein